MSEGEKSEDSLINMLKNISFDLQQNVVTNCPTPSLEYLALSKIAITLWKVTIEKIITAWIDKMKKAGEPYEVLFIMGEWVILKCIPRLLIPKPLKEELGQMVKLMRWEMESNILRLKLKEFNKSRVFFNNLCWNQQGTINYLKTLQSVMEDTNLSTLVKYKLACDFCMKDKIRDLQKNLSEADIKYLDKMKDHSLTKFWPLYFNNGETLPTFIQGIPALDYLENCLRKNQSELALQYIWENFADDSLKGRIASIVSVICDYGTNSALYFFQQMSQSQLKETSLRAQCKLLSKLYFISKWNKVLSLSKYVSEMLKIQQSLLSAFRLVQFCWNSVFSNFEDCINIWNAFFTRFKFDLQINFRIIYVELFHVIGNAYRQGIFTRLLLDFADSKERKSLLYSKKTITNCKELLCKEEKGKGSFDVLSSKDGIESFDIFLKLILKENEICPFKKKFFQLEKWNICAKLVYNQNYTLLDKIVIKFCTKDIVDFKNKYGGTILDALLTEAKRMNAKLLDRVLKFLESWGYCTDKEITEFKDCMLDLDSSLHDDISNKLVITWGKWMVVRFCWKREKANLTRKSSFLRKKNCDGLLKRVIASYFDQNEAKELQKGFPCNDGLSFLVRKLIALKCLPEVDGLLSWCFSSDESKIYAYKTTFMNEFGCKLLFRFIEIDDYEEVKSILSWFNPSVTLAKEFRAKFKNFVSNLTETNINNGTRDREVRRENENIKNVLNERIRKGLELLNCYIKENCLSEKEKDTVHSKKRKMTERKGPIRKKLKISN